MSSDNEDGRSPDKASEADHQARKQSKISYSREFLLSLSELESCKTLPSGFDPSILSEFEDALCSIQDRQWVPGSLPLQSYRRNDYGSSPPSRGDSATYSRGSYGRWESRSSGRSDRDSEHQSDWDSDSSRRHGNPPRRSWQKSEHDGLLGSGSFPRPSGYASGIPGPKARANDHYQLNRSNEPYHPPRPHKAVPHLRRGTNDSYNDETFGSSDCTSEDRVEEERRRRASFEMMRKEQKEKQKLNVEKPNIDSVLLDDTKEEKSLVSGSDILDVSATPTVSTNDSGRSTILNQTSMTRPLVPPGFANTILEKNTDLKSSIHTHETEVVKPEPEESFLHAQFKPLYNGTLDSLERQSSQGTSFGDHQLEDKILQPRHLDEKITSFTLSLEVSDTKLDVEDHLLRASSLSETHESLEDPEMIEMGAKVSGSNIRGESSRKHSTSILEKIFGGALSVDDSIGSIEQIDSKPDETWIPNSAQSSKFAHWFSEEERKPEDDLSFGRPNDLLSLIIGGNKGRSQLSDEKATKGIPSETPHGSSELSKNVVSTIPFPTDGVSQQLNNSSRTEAIPTVLTCEDLEQTILSEFTEKSLILQPSLEGKSVAGENSEQPGRQVDNHASQHLLLLLQKGPGLDQMASSPHAEVIPDKDVLVSEAHDIHATVEEPKEENARDIHVSGKALTLETLFGSAFMKELQSVEAPVSVQRGPVESAQTNILEALGPSVPVINNDCVPSISNETGSDRSIKEDDLYPVNNRWGDKMEKTENWLRFDNSQLELSSLKHQTEVISKRDAFDEAVEFQLPEEENLINLNGPLSRQNSMLMPGGTSNKGELSSNAPVDIVKKLAAMGVVGKEDQSRVGLEGSPFVHASYGRMEPEIPQHKLHDQTSSPQLHPPQMSHGRPLLYALDAHPTHMNSQMKFPGPESNIHHTTSTGHHFPVNMVMPPRPTTGVTGYDLPAYHTMPLQMQISSNYTPHLARDLQRSAGLPHPGNQAAALIPELNAMQGFPFGPQHHNIGGLGMPMPAPDMNGGSNHPEAFQRLLEMELRAKSKQFPPLSLGHSQGVTYSHELDMGFRYR